MELNPVGLAVSLAVLAPSLLLLRFPPRSPLPHAQLPAIARWTERAGQMLCLVLPAIRTSDAVNWWWALPVAGGLVGYYSLWGRYLATGRRAAALYWWRGAPAPMAVLPVAVFTATAGLLADPWVAVAAAVLAAGHIPVSLSVAAAVREAS